MAWHGPGFDPSWVQLKPNCVLIGKSVGQQGFMCFTLLKTFLKMQFLLILIPGKSLIDPFKETYCLILVTKGVSPAKLSCNIMSIVQCVHLYSATTHSKTMFKGTVQRDFRPQDFFILRTSLGHWPMGKIYPNLVKFSLSYSIFSGYITSLSQSPRSMILRWVNLSQGISQIFYTGL